MVCAPLTALAADVPLPDLKIDPKVGGSVFVVRNTASQPLTAFLIELVDYPGSNYFYWQDIPTAPVAAGATLEIQTTNMTVGAVPDYVKMRAAVYADGSTAGVPARVTLLLGRRKALLETTREAIRRIEKAGSAEAARADLTQWSSGMTPVPRNQRFAAAGVNQTAAQQLIGETVRSLTGDTASVLARLRASEAQLAAAKPAL